MAEIIFQINDIHCEKCVEKIRQALENLAGLEEVHFNLDEKTIKKIIQKKDINKEKTISLNDVLSHYIWSKDFGKPFTFIQENYDKFLLITIKNVNVGGKNVGFLAITENANDIKAAINERKSFVVRTTLVLIIVIFIFSFVLNRYFLKPIKNLVDYTKIVKEKNKKKNKYWTT